MPPGTGGFGTISSTEQGLPGYGLTAHTAEGQDGEDNQWGTGSGGGGESEVQAIPLVMAAFQEALVAHYDNVSSGASGAGGRGEVRVWAW